METQLTWGGPTVPTPVGDLAACILCRRRLKHSWAEHLAQLQAAADPLGQAAGLHQDDAA